MPDPQKIKLDKAWSSTTADEFRLMAISTLNSGDTQAALLFAMLSISRALSERPQS
jgi:hypothetical protein